MGSGSSCPANEDTWSSSGNSDNEGLTTKDSRKAEDASLTTVTEAKSKPPKNETGYARAQRICRRKKRAYDACYTAQLSSKEEDCNELFEAYRNCFLNVIAKDMEKRGVKVNEKSMIGEHKGESADEN